MTSGVPSKPRGSAQGTLIPEEGTVTFPVTPL